MLRVKKFFAGVAAIVRLFFAAAVLLSFVPATFAQSVTGAERNVIFTPPTAAVAFNSNALNFASPGLNTFLLDVQPTVSAKISITNETANACLGAFTITVYATPTKSSTFNNALQLWQIVPVMGANGSLISSAAIDIPASTTVYVSTMGISANRIAVQIVNQTGACASTNIDSSVVFSTVSLTSPLLSVTGGVTGWGSSNVQGVVPNGANGATVLPLIDGAVQPAVNATIAPLGVDNFLSTSMTQVGGLCGSTACNFSLGFPPQPSAFGEWALAFYTGPGSIAGTGVLAPWVCVTAGCGPSSGNASLNAAYLNNVSNTTPLLFNEVTTNAGTFITAFVEFAKSVPTIRQQAFASNANPISGATLLGSTLVTVFQCTNFPCLVDSVSGTQGNSWKLVTSAQNSNGNKGGLSVWITQAGAAAVENVTPTVHAGSTVNNSGILELTGTTPANLTTPAVPLQADQNGSLKTAGANVQLSPVQLGVNAITLPASGVTAPSNIVDMRGVRAWTLNSTCTQSHSITLQPTAEDGVTPTSYATIPVTAVATGNQLTGDSKGIITDTGTVGTTNFGVPERAMSFLFTNAGATPGTCTARLFLQY